jgi:hypothetical protein
MPSNVDSSKLQNWYPRNESTNGLLKQFCADYDDAFGKGQFGIILGLSFGQQTGGGNTTVARGANTAADSSTISTVTASTLNRISRRLASPTAEATLTLTKKKTKRSFNFDRLLTTTTTTTTQLWARRTPNFLATSAICRK